MTIKEIASAVGKTDRAVRNWVNKVAEKDSAIKDKVSASTSTNPADYSLDETIEIIRAGLGANAAEMFRQNAVANQPEVIPVMAKMMEMMMLLTEKVERISSGQLQIEGPAPDYYTLAGYCNVKHISLDQSKSAGMGNTLRKMTIAEGLELRKVPDKRWGEVNSYPIEILEEYFTP